jgi:hypothetical protein
MRPLLVLLHAMPYYLRNKQGNILGGIKCVYRDDLVLGLISLHPVFSVCKVPSVPELDPGRCQRRPTRRAAEFCGRWPENRLDCPAEEQNRQGKRLASEPFRRSLRRERRLMRMQLLSGSRSHRCGLCTQVGPPRNYFIAAHFTSRLACCCTVDICLAIIPCTFHLNPAQHRSSLFSHLHPSD